MRKQIRDTALQILQTVPEIRLAQIGRRHNLSTKQTPAAIVYTDQTQTERITFNPEILQHITQLQVRVILSGTTQSSEDLIDLIVDTIDPQILSALRALPNVIDAIQSELDIDGNGDADADYLEAKRTYLIEHKQTM